jgi:N-acetylneuraminic acid mutarotase
MNQARYLHTATVLLDGKISVAGGLGVNSGYLNTAELYDPSTGDWTTVNNMTFLRYGHTASVLPDGKVLVTGGSDGRHYLNTTELYDPSSRSWTTVNSMIFG